MFHLRSSILIVFLLVHNNWCDFSWCVLHCKELESPCAIKPRLSYVQMQMSVKAWGSSVYGAKIKKVWKKKKYNNNWIMHQQHCCAFVCVSAQLPGELLQSNRNMAAVKTLLQYWCCLLQASWIHSTPPNRFICNFRRHSPKAIRLVNIEGNWNVGACGSRRWSAAAFSPWIHERLKPWRRRRVLEETLLKLGKVGRWWWRAAQLTTTNVCGGFSRLSLACVGRTWKNNGVII